MSVRADESSLDLIPLWPCPTIAVARDGTVTVDGRPVPGTDDPTRGTAPVSAHAARQAGLAFVREQYAAIGRPIRATAVDPDGQAWLLALDPAGAVLPLDERPLKNLPDPGAAGVTLTPAQRRAARDAQRRLQQRGRERQRQHRRAASRAGGKQLPPAVVAAGALAGLALIGGIGTLAVTNRPGAKAPAAASAAHAHAAAPISANLPVPAPVGYTTAARWAVPVDTSVVPVVTGAGLVAAVDDKGDLVVLDAADGRVSWSAAVPSAAAGGRLALSVIDGRRVVVLTNGATLVYWDLDSAAHRRVQVTLPAQSKVTFYGNSPLVLLPDQTAGVVSVGQVLTVDVPVGAAAVGADGQKVTAVGTNAMVWALVPRRPAAPAGRLSRPAGALAVDAAFPMSENRMAVVWSTRGQDQVLALAGPSGAATAVVAVPNGGLQDAEAAVAPDHDVLALGDVVADARAGTARALPAGLTVKSVGQDGVWAVDEQEEQVLVPSTGAPVAGDLKAAVPLGTAGAQAFVTADKLTRHLLYALPHS